MGHARNVKLLRKQIRNVAQEHYQNALTAESMVELDKRMTNHAGDRLDKIAENVTKEVRKMDGQSREFRRLMMMDASAQISRELFGINVTMLAWQEVLLGELGITDVPAFEAKIAAKKKELTDKLEAEAKAEQERKAKEDTEAQALVEAAKAAAAAENAQNSPQGPEADGTPSAVQELSQGSDAEGTPSTSESPAQAQEEKAS